MKLVINADDLGYSRERNKGIFECFKNDCAVSSSSVLANGTCSETGLKEACIIGLPVGLHFNITEGRPLSELKNIPSLVNANGNFLGKFGIHEAVEKKELKHEEILCELENQIKWFWKITGKYPRHIDGHNHVHILSIVRDAFSEVLRKFNIKYTRVPIDFTLTDSTNNFNSNVISKAKIAAVLFEEHLIQYTPLFFGLETMGMQMSVQSIKSSLDKMLQTEDMICELMVHPGYPCTGNGGCGTGPDDFSKSHDRLHEMEVLKSDELKHLFKKYNVKKVSFEDLG